MGRPKITDNPVFIEAKRRIDEIKKIIPAAEKQAELIMRRAYIDAEEDVLIAVRWGLDKGLSRYVISQATKGLTLLSIDELIARAMRVHNWSKKWEEQNV